MAFPPPQEKSHSQLTWFSRVPALSAAPAKQERPSEGMLSLLPFPLTQAATGREPDSLQPRPGVGDTPSFSVVPDRHL